MKTKWIWGVLMVVAAVACKREENQYEDTAPQLDTRRFCNDPEAVNYNWDFPGKPDAATCIFPADLFRGIFSFRDSVYDSDGYLDTAASQKEYTLTISSAGKNAVRIAGFCAKELTLTAPRTGFRATIDSAFATGQIFCRPQDTVSGFLLRNFADSTRLQIQFTVLSDTSVRTHRGTAYRRP